MVFSVLWGGSLFDFDALTSIDLRHSFSDLLRLGFACSGKRLGMGLTPSKNTAIFLKIVLHYRTSVDIAGLFVPCLTRCA
jgi:hypothetical protein